MNDINVLYEDNHIIVVIKPKDILSQKDDTNDIDMLTIVKDYIKNKYNKPGNVYLGLVHRLDRRVGGVMVFAKTSKAASRLCENIRNKEFHKRYYAVLTGTVNSGRLEDYLQKDNQKSSISEDGKLSVLEYNKIEEVVLDGNNFTLVNVNLLTGRYNQIRIQFSNINHPLINDYKYGYRGTNYNDDLGLWCYMLMFPHPVTKEQLAFKYNPKNGIWDKFKEFKE